MHNIKCFKSVKRKELENSIKFSRKAFITSFVTMFPLGAFPQYIFRQTNLDVKHWNHKRLLETLDSGAKHGPNKSLWIPWNLRSPADPEDSETL